MKVGFILTGGIGDAILWIAVAKKIQEMFDGDFVLLYFNNHMEPIVNTLENAETRFREIDYWGTSEDTVKTNLSDCDLVVWNRFERDNDGLCNFFYAVNEEFIPYVRDKRAEYMANLSKDLGREVKSIDEEIYNGLIHILVNEDDYFIDARRFGIDVSYEDVNIDIPDATIEKHDDMIRQFDPYVILHDSRLDNIHHLKSWDFDKWNELSNNLSENMSCNIVHLLSSNQGAFDKSIIHSKIIGDDATFFDYLYLLKRSSLYIGTDSWPAHAAIFLPDTEFVFLKGPSSKRVDHMGKYSSIIRKGKCQACEYISLDKCILGRGTKKCMNSISVEEVINIIHKKGTLQKYFV
jgi:ADP-heptose:LPS heptosyltransferase